MCKPVGQPAEHHIGFLAFFCSKKGVAMLETKQLETKPIVNFRHERRPEIQRLATSKGMTLSEFLRGLVDRELNQAVKAMNDTGAASYQANGAGITA